MPTAQFRFRTLVCRFAWLALALPGWALHAQILAPNDLISLSVPGSTHLTNRFRVDPDGLLRLPLLLRPVEARGLDAAQVATSIADRLKAEKIMVKPVVSISVLEFGSRPVTVIGAVRHSLTFQISGDSTNLLDALARAGGPSAEAAPDLLVTRPTGETTRIPVRPLMREADPKLNLRLYGGEEIRVPEFGRVYILGNIRTPGDYPLLYDEHPSVLRILSKAGGLMPFAHDPAYLYRRNGAGFQEIPLRAKTIVRHPAEDVTLQPDDVIFIPDASGRRLTAEVIDRILGVGGVAGAVYLGDRR